MPLTRRTLLATPVATALAAPSPVVAAAPEAGAFGFQSFSYVAHFAADPTLSDPLRFLRFARERGAGGVQTGLGRLNAESAKELRVEQDRTGLWLEGSVSLPKDDAEVDRFRTQLRLGKEAGVTVFRTVMLSGRRYENFRTEEEFRRWSETAIRSLELGAKAAASERVRLAVENHKDFRVEELLPHLRRLSSEWLGVTLDTGNNLALLETPEETLAALLPFAFSVHLKDMGVAPDPQGFRLAEVPFGSGALDLPDLVRSFRKAKPDLRFSIEMATRNPLLIPCLQERYWPTLPTLPGRALANTLRWVREHPARTPLPEVTGLSPAALRQREDENARACLAYAKEKLSG